VDVMNTPGGRARLLELGARSVPVLARGSDYVYAQRLEDVARFVGITDYQEVKLPPEALMTKWRAVFKAGQRHIQQYPPERLGGRLMESRDQSVLHMGYHVFRIGDAFLATVIDGVEDWGSLSMEAPPAEVADAKAVAHYGDEVLGRLERWWATAPGEGGWQTSLKTYSGEVPLRDFLERQTWHSAQHVRQLAAVLEGMGVPPDGPLTKDDLAGLPMPQRLWE